MGDDIDLADLVPKVYEPILSWDVLRTKLIDNMNKMNEEIRGSKMDLVFFKDAMIHLLRVRNLFILTFFRIVFICRSHGLSIYQKDIYYWFDLF